MGMLSAFGFLGSVFLFFYFLLIGKVILVPLVLGFFLWYIFEATARTIYKNLPVRFQKDITRILSYILGLCVLIGVIIFTIHGIGNNLDTIVSLAPAYQEKLAILISDWLKKIPAAQHYLSLETVSQYVQLPAVFKSIALNMTSVIQTTFMIILFALFMFFEKNTVHAKLAALFPKDENRLRADHVMKNLDRKIRLFFTVKLFVSLSTALLSYGVMKFIHLDFASFWAVLIFLLNFIPTFGSIIATALPTLTALVQFETVQPAMIVLIGIGGLQILIGNIIEPRIMGRSLNLSPFVMIVSLIVWGALWGVVGMFVCVPLMVVLMLILSEFKSTRPIAILMSQDGRLD